MYIKYGYYIKLIYKQLKIILPPDIEPRVNRYKLSNTWIKTPLSDGLWKRERLSNLDNITTF